MSVKVYMIPSNNGYDLLRALDEKDVPYEVETPTMGWSARNKIKELPVLEVDGKLLDYRKAMKWIKKYKG